MPTCRTCQGEYSRSVCRVCGQRLGVRDVNLCPICNTEIGQCPRCNHDLIAWENENLSLSDFIFREWAFLALIPPVLIAPLVFLIGLTEKDSLHNPIVFIPAAGLPLLLFVGLYFLRRELRELDWGTRIYHVPFPRPIMVGAASIVIALVFWVIGCLQWRWVPDPTRLSKMLFAIVYCVAQVSATGGVTIFALWRYLFELNERVPQPIFAHTDQLVDIVIKTASQILQARVEVESGVHQDRIVSLKVIGTDRQRDGGGIRMTVKGLGLVQWVDRKLEPRPQWIEGTWVIDADRWGRIQSLEPTGLTNTPAIGVWKEDLEGQIPRDPISETVEEWLNKRQIGG